MHLEKSAEKHSPKARDDASLMRSQKKPLLTAAEEIELAEAIAQGDQSAADRLVLANQGLVVTIARRYIGRGIPMDDLLGEGNLGLMTAAKRYDPRFGTRFGTYAAHWIKQAIRQALITTTRPIRLPSYLEHLLRKWHQVKRDLRDALGDDPTTDQVAVAMGISEQQRELIQSAEESRRFVSDNPRFGADLECISLLPMSPATGLDAEDAEALRTVLAELPPLEREVLTLRYGLEGRPALTLHELGQRLGYTREWVRKIEVRALAMAQSRDHSLHGLPRWTSRSVDAEGNNSKASRSLSRKRNPRVSS